MKSIYTSFVALCFLAPSAVFAATLTMTATPEAIGVGDSLNVIISVHATSSLNTFAGTFIYPSDLFDIERVSDGNSIVKMWLVHPSGTSGSVTFAGFTPGGFSGNGALFNVTLKSTRSGTAQFSIVDTQLLLNDGAGTRDSVDVEPLVASIASTSQHSFVANTDTTPPELFTPYLVSAADAPGGKAQLVFSTTDSGSGIDHYEVAESKSPDGTLEWKRATSPYTLVDQNITNDVAVKAIDQSGNERTVVFPHLSHNGWYEAVIIGGMLIVLLLALLFVRPFSRRT